MPVAGGGLWAQVRKEEGNAGTAPCGRAQVWGGAGGAALGTAAWDRGFQKLAADLLKSGLGIFLDLYSKCMVLVL